MTRRRKLTVTAGGAGVALLVAGLGAAGAIGASRISPSEESKAVIDDAAAQLGIEPSELSDALKQALKNRIDEEVDEGGLTREQADELKERIDANEYPSLGGPWRLDLGRHGHWHGFGHRGFALLETAASYLGMSEAELREELRDKTLAEIAEEQGRTAAGLVEQLVATQTERIDEAVADGRITEEQATELKEGLDERMEALVDGELRRRHDGSRHRFWPGSGSPRAPPAPFGGSLRLGRTDDSGPASAGPESFRGCARPRRSFGSPRRGGDRRQNRRAPVGDERAAPFPSPQISL